MAVRPHEQECPKAVSMKSGLEGRNNGRSQSARSSPWRCLNEVRPRRPEQWVIRRDDGEIFIVVSMKSGLEGRNNDAVARLSQEVAQQSQ